MLSSSEAGCLKESFPGKRRGLHFFVVLVLGSGLLLAAQPGVAHAQAIPEEYDDDAQNQPDEPRTERLREARRAKAETITSPETGLIPEAAGFIEQRAFEDFPNIDLSIPHVELVLGGLRSGAGTTAGLRLEPFEREEGPYFSLTGRASLRRYWGVQSILGYDLGILKPYSYGSYQHIAQDEFYGIGPESTKEFRSNYRWNRGIVGGLIGIKPAHNLAFGSHLSYQSNGLGRGADTQLPDLRNNFLLLRETQGRHIPGLDEEGDYVDVNYLMLGGYAELDTRKVYTEEHGIIDLPNDAAYSSRFAPIEQRLRGISLDADQGFYLAAEAIRHYATAEQPFSFTRYKLEAQEYVPIRHGFEVFAFRQFASFSTTGIEQNVPFYMMETMGGSRTIRGFDTFRFRDRNILVANNEFRWQVWVRLDMALFVDAGYAFKDLKDFQFKEIETGYGFGFRFKTSRSTAARLDLAWSREGMTTYLKLGSFL